MAAKAFTRLVAAVVFLGHKRHQTARPQRVAVFYGGAVAEDALTGARLEEAESLGFRTIHLPLEDGACLHVHPWARGAHEELSRFTARGCPLRMGRAGKLNPALHSR